MNEHDALIGGPEGLDVDYYRSTGIGALGARMVGRPKYLMSCELELLSGRPFDLPGCAASANP